MSDVRLTLIGPMPPPIDGQSMVMCHMVSELRPHFTRMRIADISAGDAVSWLRPVVKLRRSASAWWSIPRSDAVYIAVKAGQGMWLTTAAAGLARLAGVRVFLHHHSYTYVRERKPRMVALTRAAGPRAHHIVLSKSMASELRAVMPELRRSLVIGNAGLVDRTLLELPLKADGVELVLGHLSNLYLEKGIAEVVDLASALHQSGTRVRLVVGGPTVDGQSRRHLDRAARELGELFEYRGLLTGQAKRDFFEDITHFVFPSRYAHESMPLVLYEAMAAGAVCVTARWGSISEQLEGSPGVLAGSVDSFVEETLPVLVDAGASTADSRESRQAYLRALAESERQLADFVTLLASRDC
ncbi:MULTISPECIES: glycosyltransferase family 4 protein [unclassified Mycobacterium]|uniref:glycosyltransferase family 4 protein n=1 Tax=unclassified Mycobacterium TaxID=2642494 RepID=UPI0029C771AC|nr:MULTISPECIES: glycosyltransferase family 4 protein [unclassified Mycobacterium]